MEEDRCRNWQEDARGNWKAGDRGYLQAGARRDWQEERRGNWHERDDSQGAGGNWQEEFSNDFWRTEDRGFQNPWEALHALGRSSGNQIQVYF